MTKSLDKNAIRYCEGLLKDYRRGLKDACKYSRRHSMLRVAQYEWRLAHLKAGASWDDVRRLPDNLRDFNDFNRAAGITVG